MHARSALQWALHASCVSHATSMATWAPSFMSTYASGPLSPLQRSEICGFWTGVKSSPRGAVFDTAWPVVGVEVASRAWWRSRALRADFLLMGADTDNIKRTHNIKRTDNIKRTYKKADRWW